MLIDTVFTVHVVPKGMPCTEKSQSTVSVLAVLGVG